MRPSRNAILLQALGTAVKAEKWARIDAWLDKSNRSSIHHNDRANQANDLKFT